MLRHKEFERESKMKASSNDEYGGVGAYLFWGENKHFVGVEEKFRAILREQKTRRSIKQTLRRAGGGA